MQNPRGHRRGIPGRGLGTLLWRSRGGLVGLWQMGKWQSLERAFTSFSALTVFAAVAVFKTSQTFTRRFAINVPERPGGPGGTPMSIIIVPVAHNRSALGQKHGHRWKSSFLHQIISRKDQVPQHILILFCRVFRKPGLDFGGSSGGIFG